MSYKNVCVHCRKAFSQAHNDFSKIVEERPCPECRRPMPYVSQKFKAPKKTDIKAWEIVTYLLEHGYSFYTAYDKNGRYIPYPQTLEEAIEFVNNRKSKNS